MAQQTFGSRLAEARSRRGLSLEQVHAQLRIRPAILEALEIGDFRHMPLKGHARNMVSSYARYLGLDSEEITKQFLSEYHEFESRDTRRDSLPFGVSSANLSRPSMSHNTSARLGKPAEGQGVRSMWDKPIPTSELNRGYDSRSSSAQRIATANSRRRRQPRDSKSADPYGGSSYAPRRSLPARIFGFLFRSPIVAVILVVILILAALIAWAMVANSCRKQTDDAIIPANIGTVVTEDTPSGDTDLTAAQGEETGEDEADPRFQPFELVLTPAEGTAPWTEVVVDGENVYAGGLSESMSWQVTTSCEITTAQPGNLTATRNGEAVTLEVDDSNGSGSVSLIVEEPPVSGQEGQGEGSNG